MEKKEIMNNFMECKILVFKFRFINVGVCIVIKFLLEDLRVIPQ